MANHGYLRYPTLHRETIVFVSDDDLWRVPVSGGIARRLTAGLSEPSTPCLSPDGQSIAFVGRDEQHPEVYLMSADGGPARRMTAPRTSACVGGPPTVTSCSSRPMRNHSSATIGRTPSTRPVGRPSSYRWVRSITSRSVREQCESLAATRPIRHAGSATVAEPSATSGSTPTALEPIVE